MAKGDRPNLEAVYDAEIAPLMTQIIAVCKEHKLPMFATFRFADFEGDVDCEGDPSIGQWCTTAMDFSGDPERFIQRCIDICYRPNVSVAFTITTKKESTND